MTFEEFVKSKNIEHHHDEDGNFYTRDADLLPYEKEIMELFPSFKFTQQHLSENEPPRSA